MFKFAVASSVASAHGYVAQVPVSGVRTRGEVSSSRSSPAAWSSSPSPSSSSSYSYEHSNAHGSADNRNQNAWTSAGLLACGIAAGAVVNGLSKRKNGNGRSVSGRKSASLVQAKALVKVSPIPEEGGRTIMKTKEGTVIVTKQRGKFYAVNARCPHMGLPMKRGTIEVDKDSGEACITCNFHNSKFSLADGECKVWCNQVFGIPGTEGVAKLLGKIGGAKGTPATVYPIEQVGERVFVRLPDSKAK